MPLGTHVLTAVATDNRGGQTTSASVTVFGTHLTGVSVPPATASQPATATVTGSNPCGAVRVDWGDGASIVYAISGLPATVSYTYTSAGTRTVTASGEGNCTGAVSTTVTVASPPPSSMVTAVSVSPGSVQAYQAATVVVSGLNPCGAVTINFGDGAVVTYPIGGLPFGVDHAWPAAVTYTITATGAGNCGSSASTTVSVTPAPPPSTVMGVSVDPGAVSVGQAATIVVTGTNPCGAVMLNYGDGTVIYHPIVSLPAVFSHAYATPGWKTVTASGMGNCGGAAAGGVSVY